jgi:hypothetical protein
MHQAYGVTDCSEYALMETSPPEQRANGFKCRDSGKIGFWKNSENFGLKWDHSTNLLKKELKAIFFD